MRLKTAKILLIKKGFQIHRIGAGSRYTLSGSKLIKFKSDSGVFTSIVGALNHVEYLLRGRAIIWK